MKLWKRYSRWMGTVRATRRAASPCVCARPTVGRRRERGSANDCMTDVTQLIPGCFYWVLVRSSTKHPEWQPARFTGVSCQSASAKWDFIGFNSDVGHYFVEVVDIGPELVS